MNKELESILRKVSGLYRKYGIKSVTMDDVARELGISKKTLYQYVHDKTDLVEKTVEHAGQCNFSSLKDMHGGAEMNAIEQLIMVNRHLNEVMQDYSDSYEYDLKKYYPEIFQKMLTARRKVILESMKENIIQGKQEGLFRKEVNEDFISKLHLLRIENMVSSEIFEGKEMFSSAFFKELFVYHIHGIATMDGLKILEKNMNRLDHPAKS